MRSKIGTQSRLAAHIVGLFLLILMLVYLAPPVAEAVVEPVKAPETVVAVAPVEPVAPIAPVPPAEPVAPVVEAVVEPVVVIAEAEPVAAPVEEPVAVVPEVTEVPAGAEEIPAEPVSQPDESGALVVAPVDAGASETVIAPLKNANLEVLGDGFYWLSPRHDLEKELAAIPEVANLIVLAPAAEHAVAGFAHVKTDVLSAEPADLTRDAADRFVHLAGKKPGPVVAAALPGARGAAFFKAAYLLRGRDVSGDEVLGEISAELEEAGDAREEVVHRLLRLAGVEEAHDTGGN